MDTDRSDITHYPRSVQGAISDNAAYNDFQGCTASARSKTLVNKGILDMIGSCNGKTPRHAAPFKKAKFQRFIEAIPNQTMTI